MNIQSKLPATPDEFLRWNEGREGKREFVKGRVVEMMINVTRNHADIAANIISALRPKLSRTEFSVGTADFAVRTTDGIRYPDIYVDRRTQSSSGMDMAATEPVLLAEILSPSSFARDFVEKVKDYGEVPSLRFYLIISHEEPRVWLWTRDREAWSGPIEAAGPDQTLVFDSLKISLSLFDIYDGVVFPSGASR